MGRAHADDGSCNGVRVVLTGIPAIAVENSVIAPAASAQNPPTGLSLVMRDPIV
jgi:hypothetical protein